MKILCHSHFYCMKSYNFISIKNLDFSRQPQPRTSASSDSTKKRNWPNPAQCQTKRASPPDWWRISGYIASSLISEHKICADKCERTVCDNDEMKRLFDLLFAPIFLHKHHHNLTIIKFNECIPSVSIYSMSMFSIRGLVRKTIYDAFTNRSTSSLCRAARARERYTDIFIQTYLRGASPGGKAVAVNYRFDEEMWECAVHLR